MRIFAVKSATFVQIFCRIMNCKAICLTIFASLCISSCNSDKYVSFSGYAQGGTYTVKANLKGVRTPDREIADSINRLLEEIDFSISGYNKNSLLSKRNAGEEIVPDRHFRRLLELSEYYAELTDGAFNVYGGPLFDIWGFGFTNDSLPSPEKVQIAMHETREHKILNFNAIAQGYSCDVIADYLKSIGVRDMLVDIGEIYMCGLNPRGVGWTIAVDKPVDTNVQLGSEVEGIWQSDGSGCGIVTSGNYRKFYIKDGKKYAHTIDPRTGYPVEHGLLSATIVAPTAVEADAIATACMVMGLEEAQKFIESQPQLEACLISGDGIWTSEGFNLLQQ